MKAPKLLPPGDRLRSIFPWRRRSAIAAVLALGPIGKPFWPALLACLYDRNRDVRVDARKATLHLGLAIAEVALWHHEALAKRGTALREVLAEMAPAIFPVLTAAQRAPEESRRLAATAVWAALLGNPEHRPRAMHALVHSLFYDVGLRGDSSYLEESAPAVIKRAREALASAGMAIVPQLRRRFFSGNELLAREILSTLAAIGPLAMRDIVDLGLQHSDLLIQRMSVSILTRFGIEGFRHLKLLLPGLAAEKKMLVLRAFDTKTLRAQVGTLAADITPLLVDENDEVRSFAAWLLLTIKSRASGDDEWALHHYQQFQGGYAQFKAQLANAKRSGFHRLHKRYPELLDQARDSFLDRAEEACNVALQALNDPDPLIREVALWSLSLACANVPADRREAIERALVFLGMSLTEEDERELLSDAFDRMKPTPEPKARELQAVVTQCQTERSLRRRIPSLQPSLSLVTA